VIFRCTQKLAKKIDAYLNDSVEIPSNPYIDWYAHLFRAPRVQYILLTHASSLLPIVFYGSGINDNNSFIKASLNFIQERLSDLSLANIYENFIAPQTGRITFAKTRDRKVIGSMNEYVRTAQYYLENRDISPWEVSMMLSKMPMGAINHKYPVDAIMEIPYMRLM
jgi:uncharacterized protein (DUF2164 family)